MSNQSRFSDGKAIDEMKLMAMHKSPGIYFTFEENPGKSWLRDLLKALRPVIASNWLPFPPNDHGRFAEFVIHKEGRKEINIFSFKTNPDIYSLHHLGFTDFLSC